MSRAGEPIADILRTLAALVANLTQQLAALVAVKDVPALVTSTPRGKSASKTTRKSTRRTQQGRKRS